MNPIAVVSRQYLAPIKGVPKGRGTGAINTDGS